ncbi:uncharacterized protein LOC102080068 isoform X4 [Oreochromis niloticus]|uniref:uncharacterized protein LOC102080068 isoform X4 n=1 Tax=Oreochromis niloticus TaxID=8128 RepID=UPI000DF1565D|nr:uncharacterized protein LOC102080068 isoform X4 [Oreochromis niloticus]
MKCEEEESLNDPEVYKQEGNFGLNEDGPELPQIKEEQEEVCTSQDVVQVVVKQESEEIFVWTGKEQFRVLDNIWEREKDLHCTDPDPVTPNLLMMGRPDPSLPQIHGRSVTRRGTPVWTWRTQILHRLKKNRRKCPSIRKESSFH